MSEETEYAALERQLSATRDKIAEMERELTTLRTFERELVTKLMRIDFVNWASAFMNGSINEASATLKAGERAITTLQLGEMLRDTEKGITFSNFNAEARRLIPAILVVAFGQRNRADAP